MVKTNLPVIVLRGIILLAHNDISLEFDNDESRNIIDVSELFHDNKLLVVSANNPIEEGLDISNFPKIGVVAEVVHKIELPNGKIRVVIRGIKRASVCEYLNFNQANETLESIIEEIKEDTIEPEEEQVCIRKIYRELEHYIKKIPYMSNSILAQIINIQSLSRVTDLIVPQLPISYERTLMFLQETSSKKRMEMLLEDIYHEEEMFEIEKRIDNKVRNEMENSQKEY